MLKTMANIGEYNEESMGIVMSPDAKPKKPLINPENRITSINKI